jgi:hypothetical protein
MMIELMSIGSDEVIAYRIKGRVETDEFERIAGFIEEKLKTHNKLRAYAEIEDLEGMSLEAFLKDLKFGLKNHNRFDKAVVVTDKQWIRKVVRIEEKLFPWIEMKYFPFAEKQQAVDWIMN